MPGYFLLLVAAAVAEPSIKDLGWMIGDWTFRDVATEAAGFEYEERGTRSCGWAMDSAYIRCESHGGTAGKPRTYVTYINYNAAAKRFEMVSMWSNHPPKTVHFGAIAKGGRELTLRLSQPTKDDRGILKDQWALVRFDGKSTWTWESGERLGDAPADGPVRFRDVATRKAAY
jgi:hypothetical protein